ncbi:MAG: hypothetical protein ACOYMA_03460 [Bacteroidia bacterium]
MKKTVIWLTIFSIAMGFLETAVVIYIREMYYPDGFKFPLQDIKKNIIIVELWRELATIIMLAAIGFLAGRTKAQRFVFFIFSFGVWDIFYYVFLKIFLNWPDSLFTWDILFLLPVPWIGPVLAPCIVSLSFIVLTFLVLWLESKGFEVKIKLKHYIVLSLACFVIICSFTLDYIQLLVFGQNNLAPEKMLVLFKHYEPITYHWWLFFIGEIIFGLGCFWLWKDTFKQDDINA